MAIIKCSECGKDISDKAAACIGCGAPFVIASIIESSQLPSPQEEVSKLRSIYHSGKQAVSRAATSAKNMGGQVAMKIGDLNGDGKIDAEDFKIATEKTKQAATIMADQATPVGKIVVRSDIGKEAVAGAVIGAVIGAVVAFFIPFMSPVTGFAVGATIGAVLGAYKGFTKK